MNIEKKIILVFCICSVAACAKIPSESITLSTRLGAGIEESRRTQCNLLDSYFLLRKKELDVALEKDFLPAFLNNIAQKKKEAGIPETLTSDELVYVVQSFARERDKRQYELEQARLYILDRIQNHYKDLETNNTAITRLLASAVEVSDAQTGLARTASSGSGGKIDFMSMQEHFDKYLLTGGKYSEKATDLLNLLKGTIEKEK